MSYIIFYENYLYGDNGNYWENMYFEAESYEEVINWAAIQRYFNPNDINLHSIYELKDNLLEKSSSDICKRFDQLAKEEERKMLQMKKEREEQELLQKKQQEKSERELFKTLYEKYGDEVK